MGSPGAEGRGLPAGPMRVLALVADGVGGGGGIAAYNRELFAALAASPGGCELTVLPRRAAPSRDPWSGLREERAPDSRAGYVARSLALAGSRSFHWLFCGHLHLVALARGAAALAGARLWLQVHGIEAWKVPGGASRAAVARAQLVTAVSRHTRERLLRWAHVHPARVRVLNNTVDPRFTPGAADAGLLRRFAPHGEPIILSVSRLDSRERYKGHEQVMRAMTLPVLRGSGAGGDPAPVYVIAGVGDDRARLRSLAGELGIAARVHFIGQVDEAQLPGLYRSADVFAMPSTGEGFGIVFLEAAACGTPVIAGDADGARDALRDGQLGSLVDARSVDAVAAAIAAALVDRRVPHGHEVFARETFRRQLGTLLADCPRPSPGERWC